MKRRALALLVLAACHKQATSGVDASAGDAAAPPASVSVVPCEAQPAPEPKVIVADAAAPEPAFVREIKTVTVDDVTETWVMRWRGQPELYCNDKASIETCPCWPFVYAEEGLLEVVRLRPGEPEDVLTLGKPERDGYAIAQRWIPRKSPDELLKPLPLAQLKKLPEADIMPIADIDHDGRATEFPFLIPAPGGCGHNALAIVIGITKKKPKLHVFHDTSGEELMLRDFDEWAAVAKMSVPGEITFVEWKCGDHGSTTEDSKVLKLDAKGAFTSQSKSRKCRPDE